MATAQTKASWSSTGVYSMSAICLVIGIAAGYLIRGPVPTAPAPTSQAMVAPQDASQPPSPEAMKHMADTKAAPLLEQLKTDASNPQLLAEAGNIYYDAQVFPEAIGYYQRSLALKDDTNVRTDLGTAIFYAGDPDGALAEFQKVLKVNPKHANALFNTGMVKWQGKMDVEGAVLAWREFLKADPNTPRKAEVEQLIERAQVHANVKPGQKTSKPAM